MSGAFTTVCRVRQLGIGSSLASVVVQLSTHPGNSLSAGVGLESQERDTGP